MLTIERKMYSCKAGIIGVVIDVLCKQCTMKFLSKAGKGSDRIVSIWFDLGFVSLYKLNKHFVLE